MYEKPYHSSDLSQISFLVTGGAGFIGSNLVEYLLKHNAKQVRILDNFSTGFYNNIKEFASNSALEIVNGDIRNLDICRKAVVNIDYVLHQAALGSVTRSIIDPVTTNEVNISGFLNMLTAARNSSVKRFVYATSSSVYGDSIELPKIEHIIGNQLSPYAITKYVNELYANIFSKLYGIETIGLRYFNVFGPKQNQEGDYAAVIPKFMNQLMNHESPIIYGDGENSRDFTFIENAIQANILACFATNENAINTVYNIAYGEQITINQLFGFIKKDLKKRFPEIEKHHAIYEKERKGEIKHSIANIKKAGDFIGYKPLYSLKQGLEITLQWFINNLKNKIDPN